MPKKQHADEGARNGALSGSRRIARTFAVMLGALSLVVGLVAPAVPAQAANITDGFQPGNIISDANFYDGNAMTAAEVQKFLTQQVPRCTIGDAGRAPGSTWGNTTIAKQCVQNLRMTTKSKSANEFCSAYIGATNETGAQIIAKVGKACGVSQKALLVMLQKEQALITDTWPTVMQMDWAMGYACPDTAPCDSEYRGFFNQVYKAAWQLKVYKAFPNSYRYKPGQVNTIQWHPNAGCGTSQVRIENSATAGLYIYTPYRPNQAALNAGWGTGDSCSTYGNRNFYNYYKSWFGSAVLTVHPRFAKYYQQNESTLGSVRANAVSAKGAVEQQFENATLYWHPSMGIVRTKGGIGEFHDQLGGTNSRVGYPLAPEQQVPGGWVQEFSDGYITYVSRTHRFTIKGTLYKQFVESGGVSVVGFAQQEEFQRDGAWQQGFANGRIVSQTGVGRGFVRGEILQAYDAAGGVKVIGIPLADQVTTSSGTKQRFSHRDLYAATGRIVQVKGGIRDFLAMIGGVEVTGSPLSGEYRLTDGTWVQSFENGSIVWNNPNGAFLADGPIRDSVLSNGASLLGTQSGFQSAVGAGVMQGFATRDLYFADGAGLGSVKGGIRIYLSTIGGVAVTGFPLSGEQRLVDGTWVQDFENGSIIWNNPDGAFLSYGPVRDYVFESGALVLGAQSGFERTFESGVAQSFVNRDLYALDSGDAVPVKGSIREYLETIGGVEVTGFPISTERQLSDGSWKQEFENGTIFWNRPTGRFEAR